MGRLQPHALVAVTALSIVLGLGNFVGSARAADDEPPLAGSGHRPGPGSARRPSSAVLPRGLGEVLAEAVHETSYHVIWQAGTPITGLPAAYQAPNRANGFRTYFHAGGIALVPRVGESTWQVGVSLTGCGYGGRLMPVEVVDPVADGDYVQYDRGPLREWYVNGERGLEQGFTLAQPPSDNRTGEALELRLALDGSLTPRMGNDGQSIVLFDATGVGVLRYAELVALDAEGHTLPAWMELWDGAIWLLVHDRDAAYPLTIDPMIVTEQGKLSASDAAPGDHFGYSLDVAGDTAVIGSPYHLGPAGKYQGSAYVFVRSGTNWSQETMLTASDGAPYDFFGWSVTISGDTIAVGAEGVDGPDEPNDPYAGAVYVFTRSGTTWTQQPNRLMASDLGGQDLFGHAVALDADTLVVGAYGDDGPSDANDQGSAYVFWWDGAGWIEQAKLTGSDSGAHNHFGWCVDVSGDRVVIGAWRYEALAGPDLGAAYVFVRSGSPPAWAEQAALHDPNAAAYDEFGFSVGISGNWVVVGVPWKEGSAGADQGKAYVYWWNGTSWTLKTRLVASDAAAGDHFGDSVAIDGDTLIVGTPLKPGAAGEAQGAAYVFWWNGTIWAQQAKLTALDAGIADQFGNAVAIDADTALIGAWLDDGLAGNNEGSAYVFVRTKGWSQQAKLGASDAHPWDEFGDSVAISGETVVIGAPRDDGSAGDDQGSAYVFVRSGANWALQAKLMPADLAEYSYFGSSVAIASDTVVAGAPYDNGPGLDERGSAYVFIRKNKKWEQQQKLTDPNAAAVDWFGRSVAIDGNTAVIGVDGDDDGSGWGQGSACVFVRSGTPPTWSLQQKLTAADGEAGDYLGESVAIASDTAVVGAPGATIGGAFNQGSAYVFVRKGTSWEEQAKLVALPAEGAAFDFLGEAVAIAGNTVVAGAPGSSGPLAIYQGAVYIFQPSPADPNQWVEVSRLTASDGSADDWFGGSVAIAGNMAIVGAEFHDIPGADDQGAAYVFMWDGMTWSEQTELLASDGVEYNYFGYAVAASGQTVVVGAPGFDGLAGEDQGAAYIFIVQPDCNSNGVADDLDIALGTSEDCQPNGIPDDCELAGGPPHTYQVDDGVHEDSLGIGPSGYLAWMNHFQVVAGGEVITEIHIAYGEVPNGRPVTIYLWGDPSGDGDPTDAQVLASAAATTANANTDTLNIVPVTATRVGPAGTHFFVGAIIENGWGEFPASLDETASQGQSWVAGDANPLDPNTLGAAGIPPQTIDSLGLPGNWLIRAVGVGTAGDCNNNLVPDVCDIASGTSLDVNLNGIPDECEYRPGDLNCDGQVDFADINAFILALSGEAAYHAEYPGCNWMNADCNHDGVVNFADINAFIACLAGNCP